MSATIEIETVEKTQDDNQTTETQPVADARYLFKTTVANKTENITVALKRDTKQKIQNLVVNTPRWRSDSQFLVDALVYYLNDDEEDEMNAFEVIEETEWNNRGQMGAAITERLYEEIDLLVRHTHTAWSSKQEFYICAIRSYENANYPVVTQR